MARTVGRHLFITGIVQGVGFRPTVYGFAVKWGLAGYVLNDARGVTIEVEGPELQVEGFLQELRRGPPPLAQIHSFQVSERPSGRFQGFTIQASEGHSATKEAAISPDVATCESCLSEILDPQDRRYGYPFTNCTNCGPRFTIIRDRPYDRQFTSMAAFPMCPACTAEYENPLDRRFHAQPNACPACGPSLSLLRGEATRNRALQATVLGLKAGEIWAIKGLGGFNLALDPRHPDALKRIRRQKDRPTKAFALMARDSAEICRHCNLNEAELTLLKSPAAPIVLLQRHNGALASLAPDTNRLGFMLPYTPLHHLLMTHFPVLLMTSANLRDEPLAATDEEVLGLLEGGLCDNALTHNREIVHRCDDSIAQVVRGKVHWIRRARGQVPLTHRLKGYTSPETVLSLGANMKNTFGLLEGDRVTLSHHLGDLLDHRNLVWMQNQLQDLTTLLELSPTQVVHDAHPNYETTRPEFLEGLPGEKTPCYHHHAHILSVLAEHNRLGEPALGLALDGTGYGADGTIWGCEFLHLPSAYRAVERVGFLAPFPLPGGERALTQTDRTAIALALQSGVDSRELPFPAQRVEELAFLVRKGLNAPLTSSAGRLFDGVSALLGLNQVATYEGQGALQLQVAAEGCKSTTTAYPVHLSGGPPWILEFAPMIRALLLDSAPVEERALRFHKWLSEGLFQVAERVGCPLVALSGGVFQNRLLLELLEDLFAPSPMELLTNQLFPSNDGGLSLGQLLVAPTVHSG